MVALSICPVLRGIISSGDAELLVEPAFGSSTLNDSHLIFSNTLLVPSHSSCGVSGNRSKAGKPNLHDKPAHQNLRFRRDIHNGASGPLWTDKQTRFVELVLVVDRSFYMDFREEVYDRCRGIVNIVNAVYRDIGIVVVLTDVDVWSQGNKIAVTSNHVATLGNLAPYRETLLKTKKNINNDNTILLTTVDFAGSTVGYATVSGMCSNHDSVAVVQDKRDAIGIVAQTMAHEMGHNLGMVHDDDVVGCSCPISKCIMAAEGSSIYRSDVGWSTCSKKALANEVDSATFDCLRNIPETFFRGQGKTCGNGIVEGDEQCDCGPADYCNTRCCVPETCKLAVNASCASGACCNMETCQTHEVGKICREAHGDCDLPEYCSGHSEYCPTDVYKWNGLSCDNGEGTCLNGMCGSPQDRCVKLWGPGTKASKNTCHVMNEQGNENGNCGWRDSAHTVLRACPKDSRACGTLHCQPLLDNKPVLKGTYTYGRAGLNCHHIYGSNKIPESFWLTPDGTPCGENKMCISQKCETIKYPNGVTECPRNCSNRGVCNNRGNCHCIPGYGPPDCSEAGHGGSFDSGSVGDSRYKRPIVEGVLLFLAILIPFIALICCCWGKIHRWWERKGKSSMSKSCPFLADCLNVCCCPAMTKITEWMVTVGHANKVKRADKHEIEQVVDDEEAATFCEVDVDFKGEAQTNSWGVADERLFTEIVTITPKSSPDLKRKIKLPSNSPVLHHKSAEALDRAPVYQQSISVDSGCVSDHEEVNTHQPVSSQMSMTSLIGVFCKFGKSSVKHTNNNEVNKRSRALGSQKSIPLSRFVVDPLAGNRNSSRLKTPPPENIRPSFSRSVSSDATSSMRIHPRGLPQPPPSAMKPHKSDENIHKISKAPAKRFSLFSKAAVSEENLKSENQENDIPSEKKPMIPPQSNKDKPKKSSPVRTAPAPPNKKPKESKPEVQNAKQETNKSSKNITDSSKKKPIMPPKFGPSSTNSKGVPPPVPSAKGNSVKAMAMKLEQNQ